ncbi:MAG: hypothetical protein JWM94_2242 [Sphingomonas bacterium]|nr:hypothetical protein [Sphingomonas bacterium]
MLLGVLLIAAFAVPPAQAKQYPPRDDCIADASFVAFRATLFDIARRKDAKALLAVVAPDVEFDFGEAATRAGFAKEWKLDKPATSGVWRALDRALSRGCSLVDGEASAPYWYKHGPDGDLAEIALINGERVNLRTAPSPTAKIVRTADWESVTVGDEGSEGWTKVKLDDGTEGYVASDYVWTGYSLRALFRKSGGKWLMTAFIAGD